MMKIFFRQQHKQWVKIATLLLCAALFILTGCGSGHTVSIDSLKNTNGGFALGALPWGASIQEVQKQLRLTFSWCSDAQIDLSDANAVAAVPSLYCADRSAGWEIGDTSATAQFSFQYGALTDIQFMLDASNAQAISSMEAVLLAQYGTPDAQFELAAGNGFSWRWDGTDGTKLFWMTVKHGEQIQQAVLTLNDGIVRSNAS